MRQRKPLRRSTKPIPRRKRLASSKRPIRQRKLAGWKRKPGKSRKYIDWIRTNECVIAEKHRCDGPIQCCHVRSRGAGGQDLANCYSGCYSAHREQHAIGIRDFQAKYGIDLAAIALNLNETYKATQKDRPIFEFTEEDEAEMERLYRVDRLSTSEIAELYNCLPGSVWARLNARGVEMAGNRRRAKLILTKAGYYQIGDDRVHRLVAAEKLGRPLFPGESVHHINGITTDNSPDNLQIFPSHSAHMKAERAKREVWTPAEDSELRRLYLSEHSSTLMAQLMGKTKAAVNNRVRRLQKRLELPHTGTPGRKRSVSLEVRNAPPTTCRNGHEYTPKNTYYPAAGGRSCRECHRISAGAWTQRNRRKAGGSNG